MLDISSEKAILQDTTTEKLIEATPEVLSKSWLLAWAMTYPKVQGVTEEGIVFLHDLESKHFKKCHLYVGLSRVTNGSKVFII